LLIEIYEFTALLSDYSVRRLFIYGSE